MMKKSTIFCQLVDYHDPKQASDLVRLLNEYAMDPTGGGNPLSDYCRSNLISSLATIPHAFSILAYHRPEENKNDHQVADTTTTAAAAVGLVNCFEGFSTWQCHPLINIHDLFVSKDYRGKGVATAMLCAIQEKAEQKRCCKLTLEVLQGNAPAVTTYEKFGFKGYELEEGSLLGRAMFFQKQLVYPNEIK